MAAYQNPINVFLSYAHKDKWLVKSLEAHLSMLRHEGYISTWCDRQILPGTNWAEVIDQRIEQALLILLLVSSDFLDSGYCYHIEMKRALERHQTGKAIVIPMIARPTDWKTAPFAKFQALPTHAKPITTWRNRDEAFLDVAIGIREAARELMLRPPDPTYKPWPVTESGHFSAEIGNQGENKLSERYRAKQNDSAAHIPAPFGAPFPEVWNVPRRHNPFFTGRTSALEHLVNHFRVVNDAGTISPQAITGLGGMGKSQVAVEYAYRWRGNYQAVLWVHAETLESLLADFKAIADLLKLPRQRRHDQASVIQSMQEWFKTQSDWLLIFDNADNLALLEPFLPRATRGHFLLTTRSAAVVPLAQRPLTLKALEVDDGALCVLRRASLLTEQQQLSAAHPNDVNDARQLARIMEGLPLALEQAGAYIDDTGCGIGGYRKLYEEARKEIQSAPYGVLRDYPETVVSVWRISRNAVERSNPAASELLSLCAFLAPDGIPDKMIIAGADALGSVLKAGVANQFTFNALISVLRKYSLINRDVDREMDLTQLSMHRIMQEVLVDEMDKQTQRLWAERAVRTVERASQSLSWSLLRSQAIHCRRLIEQWYMTFIEARRLLQWIEKNERFEKR